MLTGIFDTMVVRLGEAVPDLGRHAKGYGLTVRVKQSLDLRRFPPIPRATRTFERLYNGRTASERVQARLKVFWGVDDGNVAGGAGFLACMPNDRAHARYVPARPSTAHNTASRTT